MLSIRGFKYFLAEKTTLQSQRQKLMNKSNVMERLGVSTSSSGGKSPMTPGMFFIFLLLFLFFIKKICSGKYYQVWSLWFHHITKARSSYSDKKIRTEAQLNALMRISLDSPKRPKITQKGLFSHLERSTNPKMAFDDFLVVTERLLFSTFIKQP